MYRDPSLEMIWDCISPVISLKFIRHGVKTSLDQISITDIIDAITVKSPDVQVSVQDSLFTNWLVQECCEINRWSRKSNSLGRKSSYAITQLSTSIESSYLINAHFNSYILLFNDQGKISTKNRLRNYVKSPESAIQRVILPFLFMVAIRNETIQEKTKSLLSYLSSFWHRRRTE